MTSILLITSLYLVFLALCAAYSIIKELLKLLG